MDSVLIGEPLTGEEVVLFLDLDGVTHPEGCTVGRELEQLPAIEHIMLRHPHLRVVVSSTWRLSRTIEQLRALFNTEASEAVVGKTALISDGYPFPRMRECRQWMRSHAAPWIRWVALDDRVWLFEPFCPNLIGVPWKGQGIEAAQLAELEQRLRSFS